MYLIVSYLESSKDSTTKKLVSHHLSERQAAERLKMMKANMKIMEQTLSIDLGSNINERA